MASSSEALARPLRNVAKSLRKSSTAFSMRVFAAAATSRVFPNVVILTSVLSSQLSAKELDASANGNGQANQSQFLNRKRLARLTTATCQLLRAGVRLTTES